MFKRWHILSLSACLCFGVWALLPKAASPQLGPAAMQLLAAVGMIPAAALLLFNRRRVFAGTQLKYGMAYAFVTGLLGNGGNLAMLAGLRYGGSAAIVYPLCGMFPLVTVVLARFWLREKLNITQKAGCAVSLLAIYMFSAGSAGGDNSALLSTPDSGFHVSWIVWSVAALILFGICGVTQKIAAIHISPELSTLCWVAGSIPIDLFIILASPPDGQVITRDWVVSASWGIMVVIGMIVSFAAYRLGKASVVTAIIALYPALAASAAVLFLGEQIGAWTAIAIVLSILAAVALTYEGKPKNEAWG